MGSATRSRKVWNEWSLDRPGTSRGSGEGANEVREGVSRDLGRTPGPESTRGSCVTGFCIATEQKKTEQVTVCVGA